MASYGLIERHGGNMPYSGTRDEMLVIAYENFEPDEIEDWALVKFDGPETSLEAKGRDLFVMAAAHDTVTRYREALDRLGDD